MDLQRHGKNTKNKPQKLDKTETWPSCIDNNHNQTEILSLLATRKQLQDVTVPDTSKASLKLNGQFLDLKLHVPFLEY